MSRFLLVELYWDLENIPSDIPGVVLKTTHDGVMRAIRHEVTGVFAVDDINGISRDTLELILGDTLLPEAESYKTIKKRARR